jgi:hypothetical protein
MSLVFEQERSISEVWQYRWYAYNCLTQSFADILVCEDSKESSKPFRDGLFSSIIEFT